LVGCTGIAVDMTLDTTTYYHVELPHHDLLLVDGLQCESWLDTGSRMLFENAAPGHAVDGEMKPYAPLLESGPELDAIRQRLGAPTIHTVDIAIAGKHRIFVPPSIGSIRLQSPARRVPGDDRLLGIALGAITLEGMPVCLSDAGLSRGFHQPEAAWRWTDGCADIDLNPSDFGRVLSLNVVAIAP
jgi:hypothetical protein